MRARHTGAKSIPGDGGDGAAGALSNPAVLILAYNRPRYLLETLKSLSLQRGLSGFKIYLSQDGA